jgi:hypothetical protein
MKTFSKLGVRPLSSSQNIPVISLFWNVSFREQKIAFVVALVAVALTAIPYLLGYTFAREGSVFTGLLMNPEDSQTYFAKMLQGYNGRFLYIIPFTPEEHAGAFVGVFYLWLGHLARWLGLSLSAVWHLARIMADVILFLVTFAFIATFVPETRTRWAAYLLAIFGSGLGWLLFILNQPYWLDAFPVDFKQPGAHLFFTALTYPHVALGTALTLVSVWLLWRIGQRPSHIWRYATVAGLTNVTLGIAYPFLIYLIAVMAALYWLYLVGCTRRLLWRAGFAFAVAFLIPAPLYLYYAYTLHTNAVFRAWDAQAGTPSLPWPHYLLAYGLMLLLGLLHWWKRPQQRHRFAMPWLWVLAVALLLYAPLNPQRRFIQGVHVPLSILAAAGFINVALPRLAGSRAWQAIVAHPRYSTPGMSRFVVVLFLAFMSLSNVYVLASVSVSAVLQQPDPLFRPKAEIVAAEWLRQNGKESAVVLGEYQTGNYVAAHAGQRVVVGHWAETFAYTDKMEAVARFYGADTSRKWRRDFLDRHQVDYVWFGPREQELGTFRPQTAAYLHPVFSHETITIYAVQGK